MLTRVVTKNMKSTRPFKTMVEYELGPQCIKDGLEVEMTSTQTEKGELIWIGPFGNKEDQDKDLVTELHPAAVEVPF